MQVKHILSEKGREVVTITSDATLSEAARLMARRRIGAVVVREDDGTISGILSERDVVRADGTDDPAGGILDHAEDRHRIRLSSRFPGFSRAGSASAS